MKISLGSAQWGLKYGINNIQGIPSDNELKKILNVANINGIKMLDTAQSYGNSELRIGRYNENRFKIVTKIKLDHHHQSVSNIVKNSMNAFYEDLETLNNKLGSDKETLHFLKAYHNNIAELSESKNIIKYI